MSYEKETLERLKMPTRAEVEQALLKSLFKHNGVIKEFSTGEELVEEIADYFNLNEEQRKAFLLTVYKKENRPKKAYLWHRLLFRAADSLARAKLVSRPTQTIELTNKREWMLTEAGYDRILQLLDIPLTEKDVLAIKSYEVQKAAQKISAQKRPQNYNPFEKDKKSSKITLEIKIRNRAFRQAVTEAYDFKCAVCGIKIHTPDTLRWEVEAAHIVPHKSSGKDDLFNGLALCRLHHWAFDVGWFTLDDNYHILPSGKIRNMPDDLGKMGAYDFTGALSKPNTKILLPQNIEIYPHHNAIRWHRTNIFHP